MQLALQQSDPTKPFNAFTASCVHYRSFRYHPLVPVSSHRYHRRVEFADTDMAGMVHFSWIVKYLEEAEHALWRAAGLSIAPPDRPMGFPRVAVSVNFKSPLFFEDEFDVDVRITAISARSIS